MSLPDLLPETNEIEDLNTDIGDSDDNIAVLGSGNDDFSKLIPADVRVSDDLPIKEPKSRTDCDGISLLKIINAFHNAKDPSLNMDRFSEELDKEEKECKRLVTN